MSLAARPMSPAASGWPDFVAALRQAGLPVADLPAADLPVAGREAPDQRFFAFEDGTGLAGYGGYLRAGRDVLLRSILVPPDRRGRGLGAAVLAGLLDQARADGARRVWLLTMDAVPFFTRHDFRPAARTEAPTAIAASAQFAGLCPASAALLTRDL